MLRQYLFMGILLILFNFGIVGAITNADGRVKTGKRSSTMPSMKFLICLQISKKYSTIGGKNILPKLKDRGGTICLLSSSGWQV